LDLDDGLELTCNLVAESPEEIYEQHEDKEILYKAIKLLPEKQRERIYAYYFLGLRRLKNICQR